VGRLAEFAHVVACRGAGGGCGCGFKLDTHAGLTLHDLRQRLAAAFAAHGARGCTAAPSFALSERFGVRALYLGCAACSDLHVVL
jgi:hypothetical protein